MLQSAKKPRGSPTQSGIANLTVRSQWAAASHRRPKLHSTRICGALMRASSDRGQCATVGARVRLLIHAGLLQRNLKTHAALLTHASRSLKTHASRSQTKKEEVIQIRVNWSHPAFGDRKTGYWIDIGCSEDTQEIDLTEELKAYDPYKFNWNLKYLDNCDVTRNGQLFATCWCRLSSTWHPMKKSQKTGKWFREGGAIKLIGPKQYIEIAEMIVKAVVEGWAEFDTLVLMHCHRNIQCQQAFL